MGISVFAHGDQEVLDILRPSLGYSRMYDGGRSDQIGLRAGSDLKNSSTVARVKRASHSWRSLPCSVACILVVCVLRLVASVFVSHAISHALLGDRSFPQTNETSGQRSGPGLCRSFQDTAFMHS